MKFTNVWHHFVTITEHKWLVLKNCFRVGLYRQGLCHDMSKYSPEGFWTGVHYYQGNRSPDAAKREVFGYSKAWPCHKGRNKHHFEYWIDFSLDFKEGLVGHKMPLKYVIEMMMDRITVSHVYKGKAYTDSCLLEYYNYSKDYIIIHPETRRLLEALLYMLRDDGEAAAFSYMKELLKKRTY